MSDTFRFSPPVAGILADPFAFLASLQREAPVFYAPSMGYYVVTRYADIETIFLDHETYSAAAAQLPLVPTPPEAARILNASGTAPQPSMVSRTHRPTHGSDRRRCARSHRSGLLKWRPGFAQS